MDTPPTTEDRLAHLTRTNARWRLLAVASITLIAGIGIGGMAGQPDSTPSDPAAIVDYVGTSDRIFRVHADGSMTYIRIPGGERTGQGYFGWGDVKIDERYTSTTIPQP